jgi:hypothetical protein
MAKSKRDLFVKRRLRVRNKLRKVNADRLRLSVHRRRPARSVRRLRSALKKPVLKNVTSIVVVSSFTGRSRHLPKPLVKAA